MNKTSNKEYSRKLRKFIEAREDFDKQLINVQKEQLDTSFQLLTNIASCGKILSNLRVYLKVMNFER